MARPFRLLTALVATLFVFASVLAAEAQGPTQRGRLIVTVNDTTGGVLPTATVTIAGAESSTRAGKYEPLLTTGAGIAIFDNLAPGRYTVTAEFPGFEKAAPREVRVRTGDNRHTVVLAIARLEDTVTVGRDQQEAGSDRASTFGTMLTRAQIDELSDDPEIMRQQLQDLAGPGVTIAVDSFEGGQLPNKSQIRSIRIARDQFAAESHYAGLSRIEIITQPGVGPIRGGIGTSFQDSSMDGKNPIVAARPPAQNRSMNVSLGGGLIQDRLSFSLFAYGTNNYSTPVQVTGTSGGTTGRNLNLKARNDSKQFGSSVDYALTRDQTLRFSVNRYTFNNRNLGAGVYDDPERAYSTQSSNTGVTFQHTGPIGRRVAINTALSLTVSNNSSRSAFEGMAFLVPESINRGGAQQTGATRTRSFTLRSDVDYIRGRHSFRTGIELQGTHYRSDQTSNYLGTYHFESEEAFLAGRPRSFTKRIGDPNIRYSNLQAAIYLQDDIRLSKTFTMTPGVRYEAQTHVKDYNNVMPRFGITWAPGQGRTTYRASVGIFHDWLSTGIYQQTLQVDGFRLQEVNIPYPSYPDPGPLGAAAPVNRYLLADDLRLPRTSRVSLGIARNFNTRLQAGAVYAFTRSIGQFVGENLNRPIDGVRPDPAFANVIRAVSDGRARAHQLNANLNLNLAGLGAAPLGGPFFQWRRGLRLNAQYTLGSSYNNTDGAFAAPARDLAEEWGPAAGDFRHRVTAGFGSAAFRNVNSSISVFYTSARPLTIRTGVDDNGDLIFNDRPDGVGRNSVRTDGQWNSSASFGYSIPIGTRQVQSTGGVSITSAGGGYSVNMIGAQAQPRYRLNLNVNIQNLFNRPTWGGYSGVMTSKYFLQPTSATGQRRITMNMNLSF
jgi:hypothetical protein